jgi:hypothetical protein
MKRVNLLGLALVAVFALMALAATSAFALPENLPQVKKTWTGKNDGESKPELESLTGTKVRCEKSKGTGEDTSDTTGKFTIDFEECSTPSFFNAKCNTSGDATGIILSTGTYHYVYDTLSPLGVAVLFLPNETVFECSTFLKTKVKGSLVCLILEPTSSKLTHLFHCEQSKGEQLETTWWNDAGTAQTATLLCSLNGGEFEKCGELALAETTFLETKAFQNV